LGAYTDTVISMKRALVAIVGIIVLVIVVRLVFRLVYLAVVALLVVAVIAIAWRLLVGGSNRDRDKK
jgi:uncharacterized membrane protein YqjE